MKGEFIVYVLKGSGRRYIGCTSDLPNRIDAHNKGLSTHSKKFGPWTLEWKSIPMSHTEALVLERQMKRQKGGDGLGKLMEIWKGS